MLELWILRIDRKSLSLTFMLLNADVRCPFAAKFLFLTLEDC